MTYVRAEVSNYISTPKVVYSKLVNSVYIDYDMLASSASTYSIMAKAIDTCENESPNAGSDQEASAESGQGSGSSKVSGGGLRSGPGSGSRYRYGRKLFWNLSYM